MDAVAEARAAYARRDWGAAAAGFEAGRRAGALTADDLFALADATWWLGDVERSIDAGEEAYRRHLHGDRPASAAMAAMTVAMNLLLRGDVALGSGWLGRAVHLVEGLPDTVEHHYLRYLTEVEGQLDSAATLPDEDADALLAAARAVAAAGVRLGDANLVAVGTVAEGRVLLKRGRPAEAIPLLDEGMLHVATDDLDPDWAGNVYCHLMAACHEVGDLARAAEWTRITERWLDTLPAAVLFRGICRVHRSQVLQAVGAWDRAEFEAHRVCVDLATIAPGVAAEGHYQLGELARLRGDLEVARQAYGRAHEAGRDPQPGMALVRLAEGRPDAALGAIRAALLAQAGDQLACFPLRVALVEVAVAAGAIDEAEAACAEVELLAARYGTSGFECEALGARGLLELRRGRPEAALPVLREACGRWRQLGADHHAARVCELLAEAYRALGADDVAEVELAAATAVFDRLGVGAAGRARTVTAVELPAGLTRREAEVLALVATGQGNRDVARALVVSEKTVARHLSNIFLKLGVTSRTEAAAYAFRQGLVADPEP